MKNKELLTESITKLTEMFHTSHLYSQTEGIDMDWEQVCSLIAFGTDWRSHTPLGWQEPEDKVLAVAEDILRAGTVPANFVNKNAQLELPLGDTPNGEATEQGQ